MTARFVLALLVLALLPASAAAAPIVVNTPDDGTVCNAITCSLRGAVTEANRTPEADEITLPAGQYVLNPQFGGGLTLTGGQPVNIRGAGANTTTIVPAVGAAFRVLAINGAAQVELSDLTLSRGTIASTGGNLDIAGGANVTLDRVRITGGQAQQGGGIAIQTGATGTALTIRQSLIDGNSAPGSTTAGTGGGLYIIGGTTPAAVTVTDSTIFNNTAASGGGVTVVNNATSPPVFRGVTLAANRATVAGGVAGVLSASARVAFQGSIVTRNTSVAAGVPVTVPSNCTIGAGGAIDGGGNVTPDTDQCGLGGVHTDPALDTGLDETLQPPVMKIPANSSAVDVADCGGRTVDQRGVARPQGLSCDAGAFEYQAPAPEPTPTATPTATSPPVVTPTPTATVTPTATPVANRSVAVDASGTALIKRGGRFVPLADGVVPNGAEIDVKKGRVTITTAQGDKAVFYAGIFKLSQSRGLTTLTLTEKLDCAKRSLLAAKKPKTRKLWGDGKGKFRTKGQYSAATVRGTKWLVQDGCRYTRTMVVQGVVSVRDDVRKKSLTLRKGKTYTARPRR